MLLVPTVVLGALMSGASLPASAVDPAADAVVTDASETPTPEQLAAVDPSQTTVPVTDPPATDPAAPVDPTTEPAPVDPSTEPAPVDPTTDPAPVDPTTAPETTAPETTVPEPTEPATTQTPSSDPKTPAAKAPATSKLATDASTAPSAAALEITPMLVPPATGNNAVITVKTGGIRTSLTDVSGLAGVTLRLYDGNSDGPTGTGLTDSWAVCVSDAAGDCSFVVPNTQSGGANRDRRFWVKQDVTPPSAIPSGYFANTTLAIGENPTSQTYQFRTGTQLRSTVTYTSTANFMLASGSTNNTASGGIWQSSKTNPQLPAKCGINVALVLDLSGSVSPYLSNLKSAANTFVDSLTGTPSSVALFTFAANAPAGTGSNLSLTAVSTPAGGTTVKNQINGYTASGSTNWDRGLYQVAASSTAFDVAIVITDGNPTTYSGDEGPGDRTRFREVENGIFSANAIKNEGTRVVAMGVGAGVGGAPDNLRAISGGTAGSDYYQTSDYAAAGAALRALALGSCQGSVSVVKQVVPSTNTGETITGAVPAAGWSFAASTATAGVTPANQSGSTEAGTGAVNFPLSYAGGTSTATVRVAETQQAGYTLVTQGGKRAVCKNIATGAAVTVTNDPSDPANLAFTVDAPATAAITCTVYNRPPLPQASITVAKQWVVNGTSYTQGNQPIGFDAQLALGGTNQAWSTPRTGLTANSTIAIGETTSITGRDLCTVTSSRITNKNGTTVDLAVPSTVTLTAGDTNSYTITNTVDCTSQLTLVKRVDGGPALATSWTLDAVAQAGTLDGPNGVTGSAGATAPVTPERRYALVETGGSNLYVQQIITGGNPVPPATGSWECAQVNAQGVIIPGYNDGINGGVTVPMGYRVQCTAVNQGATLTLVKQVVNDNGGSKTPADWSLTATPTGAPISGVVAQSVTGSTAGATIQIRPGTTYNLSENTLPGYDQQSLQCNSGEGTPYVDATSVTVPALEDVTCVFVNNDRGAKLTLVKSVVNGTTGATTAATAWTLSAAGPTPITGTTGAPAITGANVNVGSYALTETGPAGYTASAWSCTGGTLTGATVVLAGGDDVTCTITNTANQPKLTLVKVVSNGSTGATTAPSAWTLSATGPTAITGAGNSPAVTSQDAAIGTYTLAESGGPAGYTPSAWVCTGGATSTGTSVTLALGSNATCTITNTAVPPHLTLVKDVVNTSGGTAVAADWTLSYAGPASGSGKTTTPQVSDVTVPVGTYTLGESGGPTGYTASDWTCSAGTVSGSTVTLALGQNATCTITNTDAPATLSLVKVVDVGQTGSTRVPADWTLTATPVDITGQAEVSGNGTGVTADGGVRDQSVFAGKYTLAETGPGGYLPQSWSCEGGVVEGSTVTVPNGGNVVCTITNVATSPHLTLVKVVDNGDGAGTATVADWTLSAAGPTPISGKTTDASVTGATVKVGEYTLSESGVTGYTAGDWTCSQGVELDGDVLTLAEGQDITCTITNTAVAPTLTLVKVVQNGSTGATAVATDWTLTATGGAAGTLTGTTGADTVTDAPAKAATYTLSEADGPAGYSASAWSCVGATTTSGSTVGLSAGDNATCTITNTAQASSLTLVKEVDNGDTGATYTSADWALTATGPVTITGATGDETVTSALVPVGDFALTESGPEGYTASAWTCGNAAVEDGTVTVGLGQDVTCTITNTAKPSTLTLVKVVELTNGGSAVAGDWTLEAGDVLSGTTGVSDVVPVGTYPLLETDGPSGYALVELVCDNSPATSLGNASVSVGLGEDVTCTFTNESQAARLALVKNVEDNGSGLNAQPSEWTLTATPGGAVSGQDPVSGEGGFSLTDVKAGTYTLSESGPAGYTATDWTCETADGVSLDDGEVTLEPGANAVCEITNVADTPELTLFKVVENTHGGDETVADFPLTAAAGPYVYTGASGDTRITDSKVAVGDYTLTELNDNPLAYELVSLACVDGETPLDTSVADPTVDVGLGDDVTCTFTNRDLGATLTLIKDVEPGETGSVKTPADWTLTATPDGIDGQDTVSGNGSGTADGGVLEAPVFAGDYTLSESGPDGFDAGSWVCEGGVVTEGVVTVPNGGNVICRITNTATSPQLTLVKVVDNGETGATTEASAWTLTADGATPVSGKTGDPSITGATVKVGTYALSETGSPTGYTASDWVCEGGTYADGSVTLDEGADVTCTITNTAQPSVWTVSKSSDPVDGSTVQPGSSITYTVTINHTAGVSPEGVVVTDDLTDVLDDAELTGGITASTGTGELVGSSIVWTVGTFTGTQTISYTVKVADDAFGAVLRNVVTPPEGSICEGDEGGEGGQENCTTTHLTPAWVLSKTSDPVTGSKVAQGQTITYTLHARNTGPVTVEGATVVDDLSGVLDHASLTEPLAPGLTFDPVTQKLTWALPTLASPEEESENSTEAEVSYSVTVDADAYETTLHNVVVPGTPGGRCEADVPTGEPELGIDAVDEQVEPTCETTHTTGKIDLRIAKAHADVPDGVVDSGKGQVVDYSVTVTNAAVDPAHDVTMTDPLPSSLTYVEGTLVAPEGWTAQVVGGVLTATYDGEFAPGAEAVFTYSATVGDVPRVAPGGAYVDIVNTACVGTSDNDADPSNDCATDDVPVKSVAVEAMAVCVNDTPIVSYSVTPINVSGAPVVSLIWWTKDAFDNRDPSIEAGDTAALLADGASQVDSIPIPEGWVVGQTITGTQLWPGAAVDAAGEPIAWPGWTELPDGTWILDPSAPFYNLRGEAVAEVRVNPSTASTLVYPPATPNCNANPPATVPPGPATPVVTPAAGGAVVAKAATALPRTGAEVAGILVAGSGLLVFGAVLTAVGWRRRRGETTAGRRTGLGG